MLRENLNHIEPPMITSEEYYVLSLPSGKCLITGWCHVAFSLLKSCLKCFKFIQYYCDPKNQCFGLRDEAINVKISQKCQILNESSVKIIRPELDKQLNNYLFYIGKVGLNIFVFMYILVYVESVKTKGK